jgi:hypothetical protein
VLIQSIVRCLQPDPRVRADFTISDPACGTGGFLVAAYEWLVAQTKGGALDRETAKRIKRGTYFGQELVARPRRMALMNLYLHNVEPAIALGDTIYEPPSRDRFEWTSPDLVAAKNRAALTIGPFGSNLKVSDYRPEGVPLVFVRDIRAQEFGGPNTKYVSQEKARELAPHVVRGGDLLVTKWENHLETRPSIPTAVPMESSPPTASS